MDDVLVVETEEIVLRTADGTYRIRRIPSWRNPKYRFWRVEKVDEHGNWYTVPLADVTEQVGLYRWPTPKDYM